MLVGAGLGGGFWAEAISTAFGTGCSAEVVDDDQIVLSPSFYCFRLADLDFAYRTSIGTFLLRC